jgi:hypothetical protein
VVGSDNVSVASGIATMASQYAGTNTITSATGLSLVGAQATNYTVTGGSGSVIVTPLTAVLTGNRPYDGTATAAASILSVSDAVGSDNVNVASGSATLAGSSVGAQPIISASSLALGGAQATNYTVTGASGTVTIANPFNPIVTSATLDVTGSGLVLSWSSVPGVVYLVLTNNVLTPVEDWPEAGNPITATNTTTTITLPGVVLTGGNLYVDIMQQF